MVSNYPQTLVFEKLLHILNFIVGKIVEVFNFTVLTHRQIKSSVKNCTYTVPKKQPPHQQLKWMKQKNNLEGVADAEEQSKEDEKYDTETEFLTG